jgi:hypothetical protein
MSKWLMLFLVWFMLVSASSAHAQRQHNKPQTRQQNHEQPRGQQERHVERGHGRNEGRVIDGRYRGEHFGRDNHAFCGAFYGRSAFLFGGIWFGIDLWPSFWLSTDYIYVDYVDGDYFLVNERLAGAELGVGRVAIVIE